MIRFVDTKFIEACSPQNHANLLKSMRREIVSCVCAGGHVRLLEEVIKLLGVKAVDITMPCWRSPPLWIAADNGNVDQVAHVMESLIKSFLTTQLLSLGVAASRARKQW